ncbi:MAG: hypothetical protein OSA97_01435 [Nevskia sp.]|nr:hypothetical protein [Nevskia sp.]
MAAQQSNSAEDITLLIAVGGVLYFLWQKDAIQSGISALDNAINPQDFTPDNATVAAGG